MKIMNMSNIRYGLITINLTLPGSEIHITAYTHINVRK